MSDSQISRNQSGCHISKTVHWKQVNNSVIYDKGNLNDSHNYFLWLTWQLLGAIMYSVVVKSGAKTRKLAWLLNWWKKICLCLVPSVNRDGHVRNINQSVPQGIDAGGMHEMYNHIGRSDSIGSAHSLGNFSVTSESALSYNRLERLPSWGSSSTQPREQYNRLNPAVPSAGSIREGSYDRLARSPSTSSRNLPESLVRHLLSGVE